jgi:uncharacterized membrane protein YfcA
VQLYLPLAEMSINLFLLLGMGLAVGFLSGMFGIGGGFILTPMLIFLGVPPALAIGTGASQVVASSVAGALKHWQRDNVDLKMGSFLIAGGLLGALSGVNVVSWLKARGQLDLFVSLSYIIMLGVVGTLMLIESLRTMYATAQVQASATRRGRHHSWIHGLPLKQRFPASRLYISSIPPVAIGIFVGWLTAIMGIGGGFLLVPALIYLLGMPTRIVIGTSVFQVVFVTALTTVLQSMQNNSVDIVLALPLIIGGVIGANYGVDLAERLKAEQLRVLLALLVIAVAIRMAISLVITPRELYALEQAPPPEVIGQTAPSK